MSICVPLKSKVDKSASLTKKELTTLIKMVLHVHLYIFKLIVILKLMI